MAIYAEDVVRVAPLDGTGKPFGIRGTIVNFTGQQISIQPVRGPERRFATERLVEFQTVWPTGYDEGLTALGKKQYQRASELLLDANRQESRAWARRVILAELGKAYLAQNMVEQAGDVALAILASDATAKLFDWLPLCWTARSDVSPAKARSWMDNRAAPASELLGASHLFGTPARDAAIAALNRLTTQADLRIAHLAEAQLWRTRTATTDRAEVTRFEQGVARMPVAIRPGPTFLIGTALARLGEHDAAARALLRVPIHASTNREFAAEALWHAAQSLREAQRTTEAISLLREIVRDYADTPIADSARKSLKQ